MLYEYLNAYIGTNGLTGYEHIIYTGKPIVDLRLVKRNSLTLREHCDPQFQNSTSFFPKSESGIFFRASVFRFLSALSENSEP